MKRLAAILACAGAVAAQGDAGLGDRASVELEVAAPRAFLGEAVDVTLRLRIEEQLAREHLIQLFHQRLDLAVSIETPFGKPPGGWQGRGAPPGFAGAVSAVVDGALAKLRRGADVARGGRRFATFELVARLVPARAGRLAIPGAVVRFAWASRFDEDFLGDRVPADRHDARLASPPLEIAVAELPAAGRPAEFTGLVGRFDARAVLDGGSRTRVGDGLTLRLTVTGAGDLVPFVAPGLALLDGFHVRGLRVEAAPGERTAVYDLVALRADVRAIPPVEVAFFDPGPPAYRTAATSAIEVEVAPAADGTTAIDASGKATPRGATAGAEVSKRAAAPIPGVDVLFALLPVARVADAGARPDFADPRPLPAPVLALGLLAPWVFALLLWLARRHAGTREQRARRRRQRGAWRGLRRALHAPDAERTAALARYLAAWLDCAPAAVVDPALKARLRAAGIDAGLAAAVDASLDRLADARFGGGGEPPDDAAVLELFGRVERQLRERERAARRVAAALLPVLAVVCGAVGAQEPAGADPDAAARFFAAGDTAQAAAIYRQALDAGGFDAAALCFDLGNCAHRLGRPAEAVLWYTRALRDAPGLLEARANLRLVERQLGLADAGERALARVWLHGVLARLGAMPAGWLLALAAVLQVLGLAGVLFARRRGKAVAALALGVVLAGAVTFASLRPAGDTAVVLGAGVRLQSEPHPRVAALATLRAGETIAVLEASPRWARVRRGDDVGWVESRSFERVALR